MLGHCQEVVAIHWREVCRAGSLVELQPKGRTELSLSVVKALNRERQEVGRSCVFFFSFFSSKKHLR